MTEDHIAALWSSPGLKIRHSRLTTDILDTARFILYLDGQSQHRGIGKEIRPRR